MLTMKTFSNDRAGFAVPAQLQYERVMQASLLGKENLKPTADQIEMQFLLLDLLDQVQDALIVRDQEDRIRFWNRGAERLYGWRADEVTGENVYDFLFPRELQGLDEKERLLAETGEWAGELRQVTKAQITIVVESLWKLWRDKSGKPKSVLMVNKDIRHRRQLEGDMLRAQRIETAGRLAASIAHDLNNVLSTMLISMRALPEEQIDPTCRDALRASQLCAEHAGQLITQLLFLGKGIDQETRSIDLGDVIRKAAKILRSTFPQSIKIDVAVPPQLHLIAGNAAQLHQVLLNLCLNARDAMPCGGTLTIEASHAVLDKIAVRDLPDAVPGEYVLLSVADTGDGIPADIAGRIFEPFFTTKKDGRNTGLGLFAVADIIRNHKGFINLSTEPKRGTCFLVYFPTEKSGFSLK